MLADALRPVRHRQQQERRRVTLPDGAPALRCAETAGRYGREEVEGLLCAGAVRGAVLRLRVTMPERTPPLADARGFATAILAALHGG